MGITGSKEAFSSKYITMQVFDGAGGWEIIPLKKQTGKLIFVRIRGKIYPFLLDYNKIYTNRNKWGKLIQTITYTMHDMIPLDMNGIQMLSDYKEKNNIKKYNEEIILAIAKTYEILQKNPKKTYVEIADILDDLAQIETIQDSAIQILEASNITRLGKPTKELIDVLDSRLCYDPTLMSAGVFGLKEEHWEWKKIANPATTPFKHWVLLIAAFAFIGFLAVITLYADEQGWLDGVVETDWLALQNEFDSVQDYLGTSDNKSVNTDTSDDNITIQDQSKGFGEEPETIIEPVVVIEPVVIAEPIVVIEPEIIIEPVVVIEPVVSETPITIPDEVIPNIGFSEYDEPDYSPSDENPDDRFGITSDTEIDDLTYTIPPISDRGSYAVDSGVDYNARVIKQQMELGLPDGLRFSDNEQLVSFYLGKIHLVESPIDNSTQYILLDCGYNSKSTNFLDIYTTAKNHCVWGNK